jgi:hypothetical protein
MDAEDGELDAVQDLPALPEEAVPHTGHHLYVHVGGRVCGGETFRVQMCGGWWWRCMWGLGEAFLSIS